MTEYEMRCFRIGTQLRVACEQANLFGLSREYLGGGTGRELEGRDVFAVILTGVGKIFIFQLFSSANTL